MNEMNESHECKRQLLRSSEKKTQQGLDCDSKAQLTRAKTYNSLRS